MTSFGLIILSLCALICGATALQTFCNPLIEKAVALTPRVTKYKDLYYMVSYHSDYEQNVYDIWISDDLQNWGRLSYAFPGNSIPPHIKYTSTASQIYVVNDSSFRLYFTAYDSNKETFVIFVSTASNIGGPYTVVDEPILYDPEAYASSPYIFEDNDQPYMLWESDVKKLNLVKLAKNGLSVVGEKHVLLETAVYWPSMVKSAGYYFLYFNDNLAGDDEPNLGRVARSPNLFGPYEMLDRYVDISSDTFFGTVIGSIVKDRNNTDTVFYNSDYRGGSALLAMSLEYDAEAWPWFRGRPTNDCASV